MSERPDEGATIYSCESIAAFGSSLFLLMELRIRSLAARVSEVSGHGAVVVMPETKPSTFRQKPGVRDVAWTHPTGAAAD
jgi:hypothetical protein